MSKWTRIMAWAITEVQVGKSYARKWRRSSGLSFFRHCGNDEAWDWRVFALLERSRAIPQWLGRKLASIGSPVVAVLQIHFGSALLQ